MSHAAIFSRAGLLGLAGSMRSMSPLAAIGWATISGHTAVAGPSPFVLLSNRTLVRLLLLAAAGEIATDAAGVVPDRIRWPEWLGRIGLAGLAGAALFSADERPAWEGAAVSGLAAGVATPLTYRCRGLVEDRIGVPGLLAGLLESAAATALARRASLPR